jgi:hypothetical protein
VESAQQYKYQGLIFDAAQGFTAAPAQLAASGRRALGAIQGMCANSDITDPSIHVHMWQQLVLPVVSNGCEIDLGRATPALYRARLLRHQPGRGGAPGVPALVYRPGPKAHRRVILAAANQLPVLQPHWLQRSLQLWPAWSLQLWNKLATADPDCWLDSGLHENVQMWQAGNSSCWAALVVSTIIWIWIWIWRLRHALPGSACGQGLPTERRGASFGFRP